MFADFEVYGGAVGLSACCLYGGSPYHPQQNSLKRGVDIVVGTPGRIKVLSPLFPLVSSIWYSCPEQLLITAFFGNELTGSHREGKYRLSIIKVPSS